jgi:hypothetical protein
MALNVYERKLEPVEETEDTFFSDSPCMCRRTDFNSGMIITIIPLF